MKAGRGVGKFQIDPNDGTVYATKTLHAGETYDMLVKASDRGQKSLSTLAQISLTIESLPSDLDEKSHPPALSEKSTRVSVIESDPVGHLVAVISADDKVVRKRSNIFHRYTKCKYFFHRMAINSFIL